MTTHRPNDTRYSLAALAVGLIGGAGVAGGLFLAGVAPPLVGLAGVGVLVLLAASVKYTDQWEKAVLLRLGRYRGLRGPGYFAIVPILDRVAYIIDQRIRTAEFGAESCLTRDTVPVNVDAIAFWVVRDAERAALEVQDYDEAVTLSAQTALRDAIGKHDLAELIQQRGELGQVLKAALEQKMTAWGIHVQSVEIRDVIIPAALEDAMSRQAQAERERQSRIILGTAETEIAHKFVEAASAYRDQPGAMNLRAMNMLYESIAKRGSLMVVPSGLADALNAPSMMGLMGATGLVPKDGAAEAAAPASSEAVRPVKETGPGITGGASHGG
ncbi:MAG TPA: slipin family protein [Gemmatimonadales bacterium]|nr:slipin family protein [Gemmatimonadales bacterium]